MGRTKVEMLDKGALSVVFVSCQGLAATPTVELTAMYEAAADPPGNGADGQNLRDEADLAADQAAAQHDGAQVRIPEPLRS
jgi:hypothetical protein